MTDRPRCGMALLAFCLLGLRPCGAALGCCSRVQGCTARVSRWLFASAMQRPPLCVKPRIAWLMRL